MSNDTSNDNERIPVAVGLQDSHGQAALLLVESVIHTLIERSMISIEEAIDMVDTAISIGIAIATQQDDPAAEQSVTVTLLQNIAASLAIYD